jgi:hypothetical protein
MPDATVKFLCEFFFTNFWHWIALFLLFSALSGLVQRLLKGENNA